MAVSKRLRFEILRRDNHACRYCGATGVPLEIDHVAPSTLGGSDAPDNLVAACIDCNAGKASTTPDGPLVDDVATDALRWRRAMETAAQEDTAGLRMRALDLDCFGDGWIRGWLPDDWRVSVGRWLDLGLSLDDLFALQDRTYSRSRNCYWTYFCGAAWGKLRDRQDRAEQIVREAENQ